MNNNSATIKSAELSAASGENGNYKERRADKTAFAYVGIILLTYRIFTSFMRNFQQIGAGGAVINVIILSAVMVAVVKIIMSLCRYTGSINLLEMCDERLGGASKTVLGILAVIFILISLSNAVTEFSRLSKIIAFKTAPPLFLVLFFALTVWFAGRSRLTAVLGVFSVIAPIIIILLALLFLTSLRYGDIKNIFPVFGSSAANTFVGGIKNISVYSDFILLLLSGTSADRAEVKDITRSVETAAFTGAVINILTVLVISLCAAYPFSRDLSSPLYHIVEIVYYGRFFQRVDGFYMLMALLCGFLYISYLSNILVGISADLCKTENIRLLSILYAALTAFLGCAFSNRAVNDTISLYMMRFSFIFGVILPLALMLIFRLTDDRGKPKKRDVK